MTLLYDPPHGDFVATAGIVLGYRGAIREHAAASKTPFFTASAAGIDFDAYSPDSGIGDPSEFSTARGVHMRSQC